jgi:O-6-methylguanine DNA methyltransferase
MNHFVLKSSTLQTPLGDMLAISDDDALYVLEFTDWKGLERKLRQLRAKTKSDIISATAEPISSIDRELKSYFSGQLHEFKTPLHFWGTPFQNIVWQELIRLPYGQTKSYQMQARAIGKPLAFRAVANANGTNPMAIIIPCHRIIRHSGDLGGYGGGLHRKKWLLEHERNTYLDYNS